MRQDDERGGHADQVFAECRNTKENASPLGEECMHVWIAAHRKTEDGKERIARLADRWGLNVPERRERAGGGAPRPSGVVHPSHEGVEPGGEEPLTDTPVGSPEEQM